MSLTQNAHLGLRVKSRSVLMTGTPGAGLSRAMSQMCVDTPGMPGQVNMSQELDEGGMPIGLGAPKLGGGGQVASQTMPGVPQFSQPLCTPDFITPVDAQFECNYDPSEKENKGPRSPCALSPVRNKRPRFGLDCLSQESVGLSQQMTQPSQQMTQPSQATQDTSGEPVFRMPQPREPRNARAPLPRAAQSPAAHRNPFLDDVDQPQETPAHSRSSSCTSAAALATMSRFRQEFVDLGQLGKGGFSKVLKVIGRLDGCCYALKRTERKLQSDRELREALKEVQAMSSLGACDNIVRYYGAWMEYEHLYIQMELCETSLAALQDGGKHFTEDEVVEMLRHIGAALSHAHDRHMAHLDVKPDNIFLLRGVHKLGDWGRVASLDGDTIGVNEGDARYIAPELLNDDFTMLDRTDIFSLGATAYEMARGAPLPTSGPQYQAMRTRQLVLIPGFSMPFQTLLKSLMHEQPLSRPTAKSLLKSGVLSKESMPAAIPSSRRLSLGLGKKSGEGGKAATAGTEPREAPQGGRKAPSERRSSLGGRAVEVQDVCMAVRDDGGL